jgi:hypothetical protein
LAGAFVGYFAGRSIEEHAKTTAERMQEPISVLKSALQNEEEHYRHVVRVTGVFHYSEELEGEPNLVEEKVRELGWKNED